MCPKSHGEFSCSLFPWLNTLLLNLWKSRMCMHTCMCVSAATMWRSEDLSPLLSADPSFPYCSRQCFFCWLLHMSQACWPKCLQELYFRLLPCCGRTGIVDMWYHTQHSMSSKDLNPSPHTWAPSCLPTELSPQPTSLFHMHSHNLLGLWRQKFVSLYLSYLDTISVEDMKA